MARRNLDRPARGQGRVLVGVCAGLGQYFGVSIFWIRVAFVILAITGASEFAYLLLWLILPKRR